jgi:uncharacterized FlaG/YvyC family protein
MSDLNEIRSLRQFGVSAERVADNQSQVRLELSPVSEQRSRTDLKNVDSGVESFLEALDAVDRLKEVFDKKNQELDINFDSKTGVLFVRVIDKKTGEVVLQVPAVRDAINNGALFTGVGLLLDEV